MRRYPQLGPARVLCALAFAYDNEALVEADLAREQGLLERGGVKPEGLRPRAQQPRPLASMPTKGSAKNAEPKR